jgi:hypothetical protein
MSHNPVIPVSESCSHENQIEYWHEDAGCSYSDYCGVNECEDCGEFATECGETD